MKLSIALAVASAGLSIAGTTVITGVVTAQTVRDLDSHEHGSAILNIAVDTNALFLELDTPWDNLVGFEHEPGTDEQWAQVSEAWALLNQPERLFTLSGGDCTVSEVRAESAMPIDQHDAEHEDDKHEHEEKEHDEDHDKHDDGHDDGHKEDDHKDHDDEDHDKHDDEHGDDEHKDDGHKDHHDEDHDKHDDDGHGDSDHDKHDDEHHSHDDHQNDETHSTALATYSYSCSDIARLSAIEVNLFTLWSGFEELDVQLIGPGGQTATELNAGTSSISISDVQ